MEITLNEAYKTYYKYINLSLKFNSIRAINSKYSSHIEPYFGNKNIFEITKKDIFDWEYKIDNLIASYTHKKNIYVVFVGILNFCIKYFDLKENVVSQVGINFKEDDFKKTSDFWTIKEFRKFIKKVDDKMFKTYFRFLFFTGCRIGESIALTFNDYDNGYITINKAFSRGRLHSPKTKKSNRTFKIDLILKFKLTMLKIYYIKHFENEKNFFRIIKKFLNFDKSKYIFGYNQKLSEMTITRRKNKYCKLAKVKQIRIHDFRHSHITMLASSNINIKAACERVGHAQPSTFLDIYTHFQKSDENRLIKKLFFKGLF